MAEHETWAKSLYNPKLKQQNSPCIWSEELQVVIHHFNLGKRTCNCGKETVVEKETYGGWRKLTNDTRSSKISGRKLSSNAKRKYTKSK